MPREKNPAVSPPRKRAPRKRVVATTQDVVYPNFVDPQTRSALIAQAAYYRALNRGFAPGHEDEDWLAAEAEIDANLLRGTETSANT